MPPRKGEKWSGSLPDLCDGRFTEVTFGSLTNGAFSVKYTPRGEKRDQRTIGSKDVRDLEQDKGETDEVFERRRVALLAQIVGEKLSKYHNKSPSAPAAPPQVAVFFVETPADAPARPRRSTAALQRDCYTVSHEEARSSWIWNRTDETGRELEVRT